MWKPKRFFPLFLLLALVMPAAGASAQSQDACTYVVQPGDSVAGVAAQFDLQVWQLQEENQDTYYNLWDNQINVGWVLDVCYGPNQATPAAAPAEPEEPVEEMPEEAVTSDVSVFPNNTLNVRSGPGSEFASLGTVQSGMELPAVAVNTDLSWVLVELANGQQGWLALFLTTVRGDLSSLPVIETAEPTPTNTNVDTPTDVVPVPSGPDGLPPLGSFEIGGQTQGLSNPDVMQSAGMTWVKFQHKWGPGDDPADLAGAIQNAQAQGFRVLYSIPGQLYPTSIDFAGYTQFVGGVAALGVDAIEVWNEQNLDREWPVGQIDPASYVNNMLAPAYSAIKANNPNTIVVSGAPAPTGVHTVSTIWADDLYIGGMRAAIDQRVAAGLSYPLDCVGVHYNAGATAPDQVTGHPAAPGGGHYSWYFQPTFDVYANTFPDRPLCYTEIGYLTGDGFGGVPPLFAWGGNTTLEQQAQWLGQAAQISRNSGRVQLFIVFNVDFRVYGDDPQAGYSIYRPDGSCPSCATLRQVVQ